MSEWLFDQGNTRLKYVRREAIDTPDAVHAIHNTDTRIALPEDVHGSVAWMSMVTPRPRQTALLDVLTQRFDRIQIARTPSVFDGLRIAYAEPAHLGVDRFLAMLAARHWQRGPLLVVGVGTAVTIDMIDADGLHRGGSIAPSPALMRESLHARAPQLPLAGGNYAAFATDTADALASGCIGAALGLIEHRRAQSPHDTVLLLHGGGAEALHPHLPHAQLLQALVLHGLARWADVLSAPAA